MHFYIITFNLTLFLMHRKNVNDYNNFIVKSICRLLLRVVNVSSNTIYQMLLVSLLRFKKLENVSTSGFKRYSFKRIKNFQVFLN